jgi:hypothetical protein
MVRQNRLGRVVDERRWGNPVATLPAEDMYKRGDQPVTGAQIANAYGQFLLHYTTLIRLAQMVQAGQIGGDAGCWLTPTTLAACMAPYDLGLNTPRSVCLVIDVRNVPALWGPGTVPGSKAHRAIWSGGGIEFYSPPTQPLSTALITRVHEIEPCGDRP